MTDRFDETGGDAGVLGGVRVAQHDLLHVTTSGHHSPVRRIGQHRLQQRCAIRVAISLGMASALRSQIFCTRCQNGFESEG